MKELLQNEAALGGLASLLAFIGVVIYGAKQKYDFMKDSAKKDHWLKEISASIDATRSEVFPNHGSSMKDGVNRTEGALAKLHADMGKEFAKLTGEVQLANTHAKYAADAAKSNAHQIGELKDAQTAQYAAITDRISNVERRVDKP